MGRERGDRDGREGRGALASALGSDVVAGAVELAADVERGENGTSFRRCHVRPRPQLSHFGLATRHLQIAPPEPAQLALSPVNGTRASYHV
jgi:hypothetical protein